MMPAIPTRGLLIREPWLQRILDGDKTWELRGSRTRIRGPIGLIRSGSGQVVGVADLVAVHGPLDGTRLRRTVARHTVPPEDLVEPPYTTTWAWEMAGARPLSEPVAYDHTTGAVIWVRLDEAVRRQLAQRSSR